MAIGNLRVLLELKLIFYLSGTNSDFNSQPASLTDSMAMVNKILADGNLDRLERIEKLEAILTDVTTLALSSRSSSSQQLNTDHLVSTNSSYSKVDAETQTISTGDISITKIYSPTRSIVKTPDHQWLVWIIIFCTSHFAYYAYTPSVIICCYRLSSRDTEMHPYICYYCFYLIFKNQNRPKRILRK